MKAEKLVSDKNFVKNIMKRMPNMFFSNFSPDEIRSEIYIAIYKAEKTFDPKISSLMNYVYRLTLNQLNRMLANKIEVSKNEVPLEAAYGRTYVTENDSTVELLAFFRTLPTEWLSELTEFALGKKKKEEITISNDTSFERVLDKIDSLIC